MKKLALLVVLSIVLCYACAFADVIAPPEEPVEATEVVEEVGEATEEAVKATEEVAEATEEAVEATEEAAEALSGEALSGEVKEETSTKIEDAPVVEAEKTSNPVGAIVAIVVVIVMVVLVALISKK